MKKYKVVKPYVDKHTKETRFIGQMVFDAAPVSTLRQTVTGEPSDSA